MAKNRYKRVQLSVDNYERVMAYYGFNRKGKRYHTAPATYSDGTPFGVLRFWR